MTTKTVINSHMLIEKLFEHCLSTFRHSMRVGDQLYEFAKFMGMENTEQIFMLGLLHDIGKVNIPSALLNKEGRLTEQEFKMIKLHTEYGQQWVEKMEDLPSEFSKCVLYHHENWDGSGYYGIKGKEIPLLSRMIRIVDTYDTMLYGRVYQKPINQHLVVQEIHSLSCKHYDPELVDSYINFLEIKYHLNIHYGA